MVAIGNEKVIQFRSEAIDMLFQKYEQIKEILMSVKTDSQVYDLQDQSLQNIRILVNEINNPEIDSREHALNVLSHLHETIAVYFMMAYISAGLKEGNSSEQTT